MEAGDVDQVAAIEREAFPTLWPPTSYRREIKNRMAEYLVCVCEGEYLTVDASPRGLGRLFRRGQRGATAQRRLIAGFVGIWFMAGDAHIVAIAVREEQRRLGLGELLLIGGIELAQDRDAQIVTLEARVSNEPAKALYAKYGFEEAGLRKGYYADNREDAVIMTTPNIGSDDYRALFDRLRADFEEQRGVAVREHL